jgi:hypothetical protein
MIKLCKNKSIPVPLECVNLDSNQLKKVISFLMDNSDIMMKEDILENLSQDNRSYFYKTFKERQVDLLKEDLQIGSESSVVDKTIKTCDSVVLDDYDIY